MKIPRPLLRRYLENILFVLAAGMVVLLLSVRPAHAAVQLSLYGGVCYNTVNQAVSALLRDSSYILQDASGNVFARQYLVSGGTDLSTATITKAHKQFFVDGSVSTLSTTVYSISVFYPFISSCDPETDNSPLNNATSFSDGMTIGWGIVAALVAAASIVLLRRAFFS